MNRFISPKILAALHRGQPIRTPEPSAVPDELAGDGASTSTERTVTERTLTERTLTERIGSRRRSSSKMRVARAVTGDGSPA